MANGFSLARSFVYIGRLAYGYEYLGLTERLVCTQTTERTHLSIAHALNMQMGCVLNGLAKTETIKDLAKTCALFSIICYCNKFTDLTGIHMRINGAIRCNGWICLSNFNHLDIEIMNAISVRIHSLMTAWHMRQTKFIVTNAFNFVFVVLLTHSLQSFVKYNNMMHNIAFGILYDLVKYLSNVSTSSILSCFGIF